MDDTDPDFHGSDTIRRRPALPKPHATAHERAALTPQRLRAHGVVVTPLATGIFSAPIAVAAASVGVGWWVLLGALALVRRPPRVSPPATPTPGPAAGGLDVPAEPPAVAGLLANGFTVTAESAPAVLLDLAARGVLDLDEVQPGRTICRLHGRDARDLSEYEELVLVELQGKAVDGVVPTDALTTGPEGQSRRWHRAFMSAITTDAQQRGLTLPRWPARFLQLLIVGLVVIGALLAVAIWAGSVTDPLDATEPFDATAAGAVVVAIVALATGAATTARLRRSLAQLPTSAGQVAAARASGLARRLHENEALADLPPAGVQLWDRLFAYAAVFGAAPTAVALLPMGAEDDRRAWSRAGGRWRQVTVTYPRAWPPAWGRHPFLALSIATFWGALAGAVLFGLAQLSDAERPVGISPRVWDWAGRGALLALVPVIAVLAWAVWVVVRAVPDLRQTSMLSGVIVRDRRKRQVFSSGDEPDYWYYLAIDDGSRAKVRALRVVESLWRERSQGETVTAAVSPRLGFVRSIAIE